MYARMTKVLIAVIDKKGEEGWLCTDVSQVSQVTGIDRGTIGRRLPYWEDKKWLICEGVVMKSMRGGKEFKVSGG